ncbi:MAG: TonB-dependent receptor [Bacteroidota bacterium]
MKRTITIIFFLLWCGLAFSQTGKVSGTFTDPLSGNGIAGATVKISETSGVTDANGNFNLTVPLGTHKLQVVAEGYQTYTSDVEVKGDLKIEAVKLNREQTDGGLTEVVLTDTDFGSSKDEQNVSGLLHSSSDVFTTSAGYNFGAGGFRNRGYDNENNTVLMNGVILNDAESGRPVYSDWGGLNDATRFKEYSLGTQPAAYSFGNVGGVTNFTSRPSQQRKMNKLSYSLSNRSYDNRLTYTLNTGTMPNGWSFSFNGSHRWAMEGFTAGTWYDAWAWFAGAEKQINDKHSVSLVTFGSPFKRAMSSAATQEAYDLYGSHYYNPNWGLQNGEMRNAKVRRTFEPMAILSHHWKVSEKLKVNTGFGVSMGQSKTSALNWYNAADPRPDYYRYLPSYQLDPLVATMVTNEWQSNVSVSQINWDKLYQANYLSNAAGQQARYIVEDQNNNHFQLILHPNVNYFMNENITINGGLQLRKYTGMHYKTVNDLLGAEYWMDIDQFAEQDYVGNTSVLQNDLNNPNYKAVVGDRIGYDYNLNVNEEQLWGVSSFSYKKIDAYFGANVSATQMSREGNMKNGRFPDNSFGKSETKSFINYGVKGGITYKISGRHFVMGNIAYLTRAPFAQNAFESIRIHNAFLSDLTSENVASGDISYIYRGTRVNARVTAYETFFKNQTDLRSFYHDDYLTFVNMALQGIDKVHQGFEAGAEVKITKTLSLMLAGNLGNYVYTSRPTATISFDNGLHNDTTELIYAKNFFVSGSPQNAATAGLKYFHPKFWFANVNFNYFDKIYLDFNPERRTELAITNLGYGDPLIPIITQQQELEGGYTIDVSVGKSWKIKKYTIAVNASVNNILDNQDLITGGYEQSRFDFTTKNVDKFPPKYYYGFGRTYFLMLSVKI